MTTLIFVYGTLKTGYGNNRLLTGSEFLGSATSVENFALYETGIPFLVELADGHPVRGELYAVSDAQLARCDSLEGHPQHYRRELHEFSTAAGPVVQAWVYLWQTKPWSGLSRVEPNDGVLQWGSAPIHHAPAGFPGKPGHRKVAVSFPEPLFERLCARIQHSGHNAGIVNEFDAIQSFSELVSELVAQGMSAERDVMAKRLSRFAVERPEELPAQINLPANIKESTS